MGSIPKGTWVEVERIPPAVRPAPNPFQPAPAPAGSARVCGFLLEDAELGQQVRIRTITGQFHMGKLRIQSPSYGGSFGHTVPELLRPARRA